MNKKIIWIFGQSGSGKSTLAKALQEKIGGVILDGDEMRSSISRNLGFNLADRVEHNSRVMELAKILSTQTIVIVALITPYKQTRIDIDKILTPFGLKWIYLKCPDDICKSRKGKWWKDMVFEEPKDFCTELETDKLNINQCLKKLL